MLKKTFLILVALLLCSFAFTQDEMIKIDDFKIISLNPGSQIKLQVLMPNEDGKKVIQHVTLAGVDTSYTALKMTDILWYVDYYRNVGYGCRELALEKSETFNGKDDMSVYVYYGSDTHSLNGRLIYRGRALMADGYNGKKLDEFKEAQAFAKDNWQGVWKIKRK